MTRRFVTLLLMAGILALPGCRRTAPPLSHTFDSPEALAQTVLDALARRDGAALEALPVTAAEFESHVWPSLPASRPERNLPLEYVWGDLAGKSQAHLRTRLAAAEAVEGMTLTGVEVEERSEYRDFAVLRNVRLVVRNRSGESQRVRLFGSILVKDGRYKVFSYVTD